MRLQDCEDRTDQDEVVEEEAGDRACWAHLVCLECGAVKSEGHRSGCTLAGGTRRD